MNAERRREGIAELRRSQKLDFSLQRDRSFVSQSMMAAQSALGSPQQQVRDPTRRRSAVQTNRGKPAMELYKPPSESFERDTPRNGLTSAAQQANYKLNVHAKEFTMRGGGVHSSRSSGNLMYNQHDMSTSPRLRTSKSTATITLQQSSSSSSNYSSKSNSNNAVLQQNLIALQNSKSGSNLASQNPVGLQMSKSSGNILLNRGTAVSPPRVHFRVDSIDTSDLSGKTTNFNLKRSKSLGAADLGNLVPDMGPMPADVHAAMRKAAENPNQLPARVLMELVRHVFTRASESARYAEPAAKFCITVIEKEKNETFLESLLNASREWFSERDRLMKQSSRWVAYVSFMYEMYGQLKRRQIQMATQQDGTPPGLQMLSLLEQCCQVCLKPPSVNSLSEIECLFFVLTSIGRDLEHELPSRLQQLMAAVRDALLLQSPPPGNKKTLLQLIELHAARWKLPATTVRYYHPGAAK